MYDTCIEHILVGKAIGGGMGSGDDLGFMPVSGVWSF